MVVQGGDLREVPELSRTRWDDLPGWQQAAIVAVGAAEVVLTTVAVADLVRRPRAAIRGPKALWALGFGVQPFGPLVYLLAGRRR